NGRKAKVACMGLAFKPDIDDLRESPAVYITKSLISQGIDVLAVEPNISTHKDFDIIDFETAINNADIIVYLVAHKEFKGIKILDKNVIDFCGINKWQAIN
ncbi:UDP binding domain-containing protein, partial [Aliarcobacter butzleri]